ncbi:hypothetical protein SLAV_38310 [Streptomyces lavendulae subsp. lavendulae]|uniref:Uncharacterized protein n=1 Tax=Streptomyces lavendulae subsp. lavendulae TaxID=58340 RepID=A0A2K8PRQ0_STRLA|nr:hypothetical protein SLAV_38310 [Streptomyces lavendulae subsp. lavendulae]QUQ59233.1 hypothetical protein SLLC_36445 [Streptomyces lavendulae subsp. lavendulae]
MSSRSLAQCVKRPMTSSISAVRAGDTPGELLTDSPGELAGVRQLLRPAPATHHSPMRTATTAWKRGTGVQHLGNYVTFALGNYVTVDSAP